jgi:predicted RNase H-like HicB family nuclease
MTQNEMIGTINAHYDCTFRPEPEGGYTVRCRAFPEIVSYGASLEEARHNAREALELCIEVYHEKGWPLPVSDGEPQTKIKELVPVNLARL